MQGRYSVGHSPIGTRARVGCLLHRGVGAEAAKCPLFEPLRGTETMIRPLFDRVVIERTEEATKTASGLFLPETAKEKPAEGVVVAVGNGRVNDKGETKALTVKVGDKVLFGKYAGTEIKVQGEERLILREDDILGIIEG